MTVQISSYVQQLAQMASNICGLDPNVILAHWDAEQGISSTSDWYYNNPAGLNHGLSEADALSNGVGVDNLLMFPTPAAGATAYAFFIKYDSAFAGIRAAIATGNPSNELNAIWQSPWAASHYYGGTSLISAYNAITGQNVQIIQDSSNTNSQYPAFTNISDTSTNNPITYPPTNYSVEANSQRTGDVLFGRRYRIYVADKNGVTLDVSDLHCTFNIQIVPYGQQPPYSTIEIYNLDPETENRILTQGDRVVVEAGYVGNQYGVIFDGNIVLPVRDRPDNVSYRLTINALSSTLLLNQVHSMFTTIRGESQRTLVGKLASKSSVPTPIGDISPMFSDAQLPRGKTYFGLLRDYLRQMEQGNNVRLDASNGTINLVHASDPPKGSVIKLDSTSGLIGQPSQSDIGITFECLLNPAFGIDTMVQIDNSLIQAQTYTIGSVPRQLSQDGLYRIISIEHQGDTRGTNWYTTCQTVSQAGGIPGMATSSSSNINGT